ncbi:YbhB/YbcL family Raf kinase inhibitor-like protein [Arthrobacter sp. SA17]
MRNRILPSRQRILRRRPGSATGPNERSTRSRRTGRVPATQLVRCPRRNQGYAVTVFDPDAPGGGYWHWAVANLPADTTSLPAGAGSRDNALLPSGAVQLKNDAGFSGFVGAAPPPGHGPHRYLLVVHALDTEQLHVASDDSAASIVSKLADHTLGRSRLTGMFERR